MQEHRHRKRPPQDQTLDEAIEEPTPESKRLVELIDRWSVEQGYQVRRESKSIRLMSAGLGDVAYIYPTYDTIEFGTGRLRRQIGQSLADFIVKEIGSLDGGYVTEKFCGVYASDAVPYWDTQLRPRLEEIMVRLGQADLLDPNLGGHG